MAIIFVEAVVEIEVDSALFSSFRSRVHDIKYFGHYLGGLFTCGYCLSVWVSAIVAALYIPTRVGWIELKTDYFALYWIINFILNTFILHRLSGIWHELIKRWFDRVPFVLAFRPTSDIVKILDSDILPNNAPNIPASGRLIIEEEKYEKSSNKTSGDIGQNNIK